MFFHDAKEAEILRSCYKVDKLGSEPYDTCSESDDSRKSDEFEICGLREFGGDRIMWETNDTEASKHDIWVHWQSKFRHSSVDLMCDYVDPIVELHMTLPDWWSNEGGLAVEVRQAENGGWECLAHHREGKHLQHPIRKNKNAAREAHRLNIHCQFLRV